MTRLAANVCDGGEMQQIIHFLADLAKSHGVGVGLVIVTIGGGLVTQFFLWLIRDCLLRLGDKPGKQKRVEAWITGIVERSTFAIFIVLDISGIAPAMIAWLAVKLVTNWNRPDSTKSLIQKPFAFTALLAGLVSMMFAAVGGWFIRRGCESLLRNVGSLGG